jgi:hypothetical protein
MTKAKFAALTAGLLARKGEAVPTAHTAFMQAQAWAGFVEPHDHPREKAAAQPHDLGALIERAPRPVPPASPPPVPASARPQPAALLPASSPQASSLPGPVFGLRGHGHHVPSIHRTAVTARLDEPRYLRLKLTALRYQRSYQDILVRALDAYLTALGVEKMDEENLAQWRRRFAVPR